MSIQYFEPKDRPYGLTYGQWTIKWWQWLLQIPKDKNPALDETGKNIEISQNNDYVSFLTGTFVNTIKTPHRIVTLPAGRAILIAIINYQANFMEDSMFKNESELKNHVINDIKDIVRHEVLIDNKKLEDGVYRVGSDPSLFPVKIAANIPHGVNGIPYGVNGVDDGSISSSAGITQAVADGYWIFLKPPPVGKYKIDLFGACTGGVRKIEAHYTINLV